MAYKTTRKTKRDGPQQEEEVRCRKEDAKENTAVKKKSKKKEESDEPRKSRRPDLKAISQVQLQNQSLCFGLNIIKLKLPFAEFLFVVSR